MAYTWAPLPEGLSPAQRRLVVELRALKDTHRLTFKQLGRLTHYSHASWERWLNGKRPITPQALQALIDALDIDGVGLLRVTEDAAGLPAAASVLPAQLPAVALDFVGRRQELRQLVDLLSGGSDTSGQVSIVAITGCGGLGKTTLALQAAHLSRHHFPDGQFYVDLRGADMSQRDPADVLAGWLLELGDNAAAMPVDLEARAARFRSLLASRRMLLVLDNAASAVQIRPLIPGTAGCAVLITARARLSDLIDARHLALGTLELGEAQDLLGSLIGRERAAADAESVDRVVTTCGGLPLALRIAAARLAGRTSWTIEALANRLDDEHRRLNTLAVGDVEVRAAFQASHRNLPDSGAARAFRLLGLLPGNRFTAHSVAALLDVRVEIADDLLEVLLEAHLVEPDIPGHYRLHDLLHSYARELADREEDGAARRAAVARLASWYLHTCYRARDCLDIMRPKVDLSAVEPPAQVMTFADHEEAFAWLDAERANLVVVARQAAEYELGPVSWLLARGMITYQMMRGLWQLAIETMRLGLAAARAHDETPVVAVLLSSLCTPYTVVGEHDLAIAGCREACEIVDPVKSPRDAAYSAVMLADALGRRAVLLADGAGLFEEALDWYRRGIAWYRAADVPRELGCALNNMAYAHVEHGRFAEAVPLAEESLRLARACGSGNDQATVLDTLGMALRGLGNLDAALDALRNAVQAYQESDNHFLGAGAMDHYADTLALSGRVAEAQEIWRHAADWFDSFDEPRAAAIRAKATADPNMVPATRGGGLATGGSAPYRELGPPLLDHCPCRQPQSETLPGITSSQRPSGEPLGVVVR
jgi:tetratricopeptide (TPR) repeat protein/transcriptional regulator with XRE-family HTH domain